jgi:hypothetical protein
LGVEGDGGEVAADSLDSLFTCLDNFSNSCSFWRRSASFSMSDFERATDVASARGVVLGRSLVGELDKFLFLVVAAVCETLT